MSGRVITFYSYKGGTGRSLALANVAWILASNRKRVLVIDWDLEAPGIHRYFKPFLIDPDLRSTPGLIDFVWDLANSTLASRKVPMANIDSDETPSLASNAVRLDWEFEEGGHLDLLGAGRQGPSYSKRVNSFDWENFYNRLGGGHLLDRARDALVDEYDYVLIDSRTGVTDSSGICTVQMPDTVVACFTLNNQGIEGATAILRSVVDQRSDGAPEIFPLACRIELGEKEKVDAARRHARDRFKRFVTDKKDALNYWDDMEVLYQPYYAYEEILSTFGDEAGSSGSANTMLASMERVSRRTTGLDVRMPEIPPVARRQVLDAYAYEPARDGAHEGPSFSLYAEKRREQLISEFEAWLQSDMDPSLLISRRSLGVLDRFDITPDSMKSPPGIGEYIEESAEVSRYRPRMLVMSVYFAACFAVGWYHLTSLGVWDRMLHSLSGGRLPTSPTDAMFLEIPALVVMLLAGYLLAAFIPRPFLRRPKHFTIGDSLALVLPHRRRSLKTAHPKS